MAAYKGSQNPTWIEIQGGLNFNSGVTAQELVQAYGRTVDKYDGYFLHPDTKLGGYDQIRQVMSELYPSNRADVVVMDVGAGTGNVGVMLTDMGFTTLDALEPSNTMLARAVLKGIYRHLYNVFLTDGPVDLQSDRYDVIVMNGVILPNSIPCVAFKELARIVKPGGHIVMANRAAYIDEGPDYSENWGPLVSSMEQQGIWKLLRKQRYPNHTSGQDGWLMVFQIC